MNRLSLAFVLWMSIGGLGAAAQQSHVIDDAALHTRWVLVVDPQRPSGPGHWVPAGEVPPGMRMIAKEQKQSEILVHTGENVVVSRRSETVKLQLEAKALENAAEGARLHVRLKTGAIVEAIATAAGQVELAPHFERHTQ
jgi:hypothetical protein